MSKGKNPNSENTEATRQVQVQKQMNLSRCNSLRAMIYDGAALGLRNDLYNSGVKRDAGWMKRNAETAAFYRIVKQRCKKVFSMSPATIEMSPTSTYTPTRCGSYTDRTQTKRQQQQTRNNRSSDEMEWKRNPTMKSRFELNTTIKWKSGFAWIRIDERFDRVSRPLRHTKTKRISARTHVYHVPNQFIYYS